MQLNWDFIHRFLIIIAAIDPAASMAAADDPVLEEIAAAIGVERHAVIAAV